MFHRISIDIKIKQIIIKNIKLLPEKIKNEIIIKQME